MMPFICYRVRFIAVIVHLNFFGLIHFPSAEDEIAQSLPGGIGHCRGSKQIARGFFGVVATVIANLARSQAEWECEVVIFPCLDPEGDDSRTLSRRKEI